MNILLAIIYHALALLGIDVGSQTRIDLVRTNGTDVLYSKVVMRATDTRFECVRSASGQCYYTVLARDCVPAPGPPSASASRDPQDCLSRPVERFALAKGGSRRIQALSGLRLCVSTQAGITGADCNAERQIAAP